MTIFTHTLAVSSILLLGACASSPTSMQAAYVSDIQYQDYSCKQMASELSRISRKKEGLYSTLESKAERDTAQMAVGMLLFWPALFFLEGGDGAEAQEYRRLKGEYEALEQARLKKGCDAPV